MATPLDDLHTVAVRIKFARERVGIRRQADLAKALDVSRSAVSEWELGRSEPSSKQLRNIAVTTSVNFDWLATGRGMPGSITAAPPARLVGVVQADQWREGIDTRTLITQVWMDNDAVEVITIPNSAYPGMRQFAFEIKGSSANGVAADGEFVVCVDYQRARPSGPFPSDLVVVDKSLEDRHKTTLMRLWFNNGGWELRYPSTDPKYADLPPIRLEPDLHHEHEGTRGVDIIGLALGFYRDSANLPFPTPPENGGERANGNGRTG